MTMHPGVSVVIPVFRSEPGLNELYDQLVAVLPAMAHEVELILVEDAGGDGSWAIIEQLAGRDPRVRGLRLSRNFGQHNALLAGIRAARHAVIVTMDDDLQHPVSEIAALLAALGPDQDVVYGMPIQRQHGLFRSAASHITRLALAVVVGSAVARHVSAFRAFRTPLRDGFAGYDSPHVSIDVLLSWVTTRIVAIPVRHAPRRYGASGYSLGRLIHHAIDLITGFSALPLRLASIGGFLAVLFGLGMLAIVLINYLVHGSAVPGFAFLASLIVIFSGMQLCVLGVFGEYLARLHFRGMNRPPYVIGGTAGHDPSNRSAG